MTILAPSWSPKVYITESSFNFQMYVSREDFWTREKLLMYMTANWVFFCGIFQQWIKNTSYPEKWGTLFANYFAKIWLSSTAIFFSYIIKNQNPSNIHNYIVHLWYMYNWFAKQQLPLILKIVGEVIHAIRVSNMQYYAPQKGQKFNNCFLFLFL